MIKSAKIKKKNTGFQFLINFVHKTLGIIFHLTDTGNQKENLYATNHRMNSTAVTENAIFKQASFCAAGPSCP